MKTIILIISFILTFLIVSGQERKGFIVDPDGYSNVREAADGKSSIVTKILDGEIFKYKVNESSWYPVETYNGIHGFMHKSRIKEFKINRNFCFNENLDEIFLFRKNQKIISVCGIPANEIEQFKAYSGLVVYDALNKRKLQEFREGSYQSFEFNNGDILIYEYKFLPINNDFEGKFVPYVIHKVLYAGERLIIVKNAPYYDFPILSQQEITEHIEYLKSRKFTFVESYKAVQIALVVALNGSIEGEKIFLNILQEIDIQLDGEYYENYHKALEVYQINKKQPLTRYQK